MSNTANNDGRESEIEDPNQLKIKLDNLNELYGIYD